VSEWSCGGRTRLDSKAAHTHTKAHIHTQHQPSKTKRIGIAVDSFTAAFDKASVCHLPGCGGEAEPSLGNNANRTNSRHGHCNDASECDDKAKRENRTKNAGNK
jgi:hypothetical protein